MSNVKGQMSKVKAGFSFIELIIAMAIFGIMTAAMLVSLQGGKDAKAVEVAAREVAAAIREAQNNALTGKITAAGEYPCKFSFISFSPNSSSYKINYEYYTATGGNSCLSSPNIADTIYQLKNGVTFSGGIQTITFGVPHGSLTADYAITVSKSSLISNICVYQSGRVEEKGTSGCT